MAMTEFIFVRHGETVANISKILQGHLNSELTGNGIAQAKATAAYLADKKIDVMFTSDLKRAKDTAELIHAGLKSSPELIVTESLREWRCGSAEGRKWQDVIRESPELLDAFTRERDNIRFPGGETRMEFQKRIDDFLSEVLERYRGKHILMVSHGGVAQRMFRTVAGVVSDGNLIPLGGNASISSFVYDDERNGWQLVSWNCRDHLAGLTEYLSLAF